MWAQSSAVVAPAALLGAWLTPAQVWWLTPTAVTVAGIAHVVTATGLRPVDPAGRGLLAAGGALTVVSAWLPMVGRVGLWHTTVTNLGWVTLCVWPALVAPDRQPLPRVLRRSFGEGLAVGLGALLLLCVVTRETVIGAGQTYGLPQQLLMTAQAAVPLLIIVGLKFTRDGDRALPARRTRHLPRRERESTLAGRRARRTTQPSHARAANRRPRSVVQRKRVGERPLSLGSALLRLQCHQHPGQGEVVVGAELPDGRDLEDVL